MRPIGSIPAFSRCVALVLAVALVAPQAVLGRETSAPPPFPVQGTDILARDSWLVTLADGVDVAAEAPALARAARGEVGLVYEHAVRGFQFKGPAAAAEALGRNPKVRAVEPDRPIFMTETLPYGVQRIAAFGLGEPSAYQAGYRGSGARIAVLDTGIDLDHPDLVANIDAASGRNCLNAALAPDDGHGHGTHVAGTAAAPLNAIGVVGVAPESQLLPIKMFDDAGNSAESLALCALDRVTELNTDGDSANDVDVVNMSWGALRAWGPGCEDEALHRAICAASASGAVLVGGAGNSATDAGAFVPAAFPEVISVSALADFDGKPGGLGGCAWVPSLGWFECDDTFAFFSDHGPSVDLIAPGVSVYSTWAGGGYRTADGTSMATPHVSGVVALMAAAHPGLTAAEALDALRLTGECPSGAAADADGITGCAGQGTWVDDPDGIPEVLPNALRAAQAVAGGGAPPPPPPPPEPTVPAAPTLTSATGGASSVTLGWTTPSDGGSPITGYQVWRGTAPGAESLLTTVGVGQTFVDETVTPGTTYWYQIAAVNAIGAGPRSNELSASTAAPPGAPTLLGAPADGAVALSWTEPDDGGSAITGYNIYRRVGTGAEGLFATTGAAETIYVDGAVDIGTEYTYRVTAVNAAGEGARSNAVSVTPTQPDAITAPDPPTLTGTRAKGSFGIRLTWSLPASDGGSPISSYFIYRRGPGEASLSLFAIADAATRSHLDDSVERRATYTYAVTAFNSYHESQRSNEVTVRSK